VYPRIDGQLWILETGKRLFDLDPSVADVT